MIENIKKAAKIIKLSYVIAIVLYSCTEQEKSFSMYEVKDIELYKSTVDSLYHQQRIIEQLKSKLSTAAPECSYIIHIMDRAINNEYPGYSGDFRYLGTSFLEKLTKLTIELEQGEGLKIITPENMDILDEDKISFDEGFIKQIVSTYGLFLIHKPEILEAFNSYSLLIVMHALNIKALKISGGQDLLRIENLGLLLSQIKVSEYSLNPLFSLIKNDFVDYNAFIDTLNVVNDSLENIEKLKIQQVVDLMNTYRL